MAPRHHMIVGAALLLVAAALAGLGQHDGVVGMTPPESFPSPGRGPSTVTTRVAVDGPVKDDQLRSTLGLDGRNAVMAHLDGAPERTPIVLVLSGPVPAAGRVLVVQGSMETLTGGIVRLDAQEMREPLVFKHA